MPGGHLSLDAGSSASVDYDFKDEAKGTIRLPEAFFTAHGETIHRASLELEDGPRRTVDVTFGPRVGEAQFSIVE